MSRSFHTQDDYTRFLSGLRTLSPHEKQQLWDEAGRAERWGRAFWIVLILAILLFLASQAFAAVGDSRVIPGNAFRGNGALADAATITAYEAALNTAESLERQAWRQGSEADPQPVQVSTLRNGSVVLAQNAPRQITRLSSGDLGLSDRHTTITIIKEPEPTPIPRPIIQPKEKASLNHDIHGDDFSASLVIPEDTGVDALRVLQAESNNITDRDREKLTILDKANVMEFNAKLYELTTARQTSLGWLTLPLIVVCSLCGVYIYKTVTHDRRERLKVELGAINDGRR